MTNSSRRMTSLTLIAIAVAIIAAASIVGRGHLFHAAKSDAESFLCGGGLSYRMTTAGVSAAETVELRPHIFRIASSETAQSGLRVADVLSAVGSMPGLQHNLSFDAAVGPASAEMAASATSDEEVKCAITREAKRLFDQVGSKRLDDRLKRLTVSLTAGRYDLASKLDSLVTDFAPRLTNRVENEVGLGQPLFELVKTRVANLPFQPLNRTDVLVRYTDERGLFTYSSDTIRLDVRAIRIMLVSDYLYYRQGSGYIDSCFSGLPPAGEMETICANLKSRIAAQKSPWTSPTPLPASPVLGNGVTLADVFDLWRKTYGEDVVEEFFDEIWTFIRAAAVANRTPESGCFAVDGRGRLTKLDRDCPNAIAIDHAVGSFVRSDARRVFRWFRLVLSHEIAHHVLRHSQATVSELTTTLQRGSGSAADISCDAHRILETEADMVGVSLLTSSATAADIMDYFGSTISLSAETDLADATSATAKRLFTSWAPFFDGYVGFFEGGIPECGYYFSKTRQILFHAMFFLTFSDDDARALAPVAEPDGPQGGAVAESPNPPEKMENCIWLKTKSHSKFVAVFFEANWCDSCPFAYSALRRATKQSGTELKIINVDKDELAALCKVYTIPTTIFFLNGQPVKRLVGAQPSRWLKSVISEAKQPAEKDVSHQQYQ